MSQVFKGRKTFEVGSGVSSPPVPHPPWRFIVAVGWIYHSLNEIEGESDGEKPSQGYTTLLARVALEPQPLPGGVFSGEVPPCTCPLLGFLPKRSLLLFLDTGLWSRWTCDLKNYGLFRWNEASALKQDSSVPKWHTALLELSERLQA